MTCLESAVIDEYAERETMWPESRARNRIRTGTKSGGGGLGDKNKGILPFFCYMLYAISFYGLQM